MLSQYLLSSCLNLSCLYNHEAGPKQNPLNPEPFRRLQLALDQALSVHAGGPPLVPTSAEGTASRAVRCGSAREILGAAGSSWCGFGDSELLSWLLSWHMSIERFCKMQLPHIRGGHVLLLGVDTEMHVLDLLPWARLEGRSFVAASEQVHGSKNLP